MTVAAAAALAALVGRIAADVIGPTLQPRTPGRVRPPDSVTCPRDRLTAYTGIVTRLSRQRQRTVLEIRTDWDTTEEVVVTHEGDGGPERWFLIRTKPFQASDWAVIEAALANFAVKPARPPGSVMTARIRRWTGTRRRSPAAGTLRPTVPAGRY